MVNVTNLSGLSELSEFNEPKGHQGRRADTAAERRLNEEGAANAGRLGQVNADRGDRHNKWPGTSTKGV